MSAGQAIPKPVVLGHSGSTSAHAIVAELTRNLRAALPTVWIVYGGVFPTYHWREILPWRFPPAFGQDGALLAGNRCLYRERKP